SSSNLTRLVLGTGIVLRGRLSCIRFRSPGRRGARPGGPKNPPCPRAAEETMRPLAVALAAMSASMAPASAHHSQAAYDLDVEVLIEGTLAEVAWRNPHIYLKVETRGTDGVSFLQEVEVGPIAAVRTYGLTRDDLTEGAPVTVRARPNRRGPGRTVPRSEARSVGRE